MFLLVSFIVQKSSQLYVWSLVCRFIFVMSTGKNNPRRHLHFISHNDLRSYYFDKSKAQADRNLISTSSEFLSKLSIDDQ